MTIHRRPNHFRFARSQAAMLGRNALIAGGLVLLLAPVVSWAQVVTDTKAGNRQPRLDMAANGVPVIDIVAPNAAGVSHNLYSRFDVDGRGVILNNSAAIVRTQLGGYVAGNDNLKSGSASLILNEVTSGLPSNLKGYMEVAGRAAPLVIANPYGITCDGCGVINAPRFTLTTGRPVFGGSGSLDAFRVTGGNITVGAGGLNAWGADRADLLARAVAINGQLWAKDLDVVTGNNRIGYANHGIQSLATNGAHPAVAIDVAALGGMYANKIRLVGTEAGVGVVSNGVIDAQAGGLTLDNAGRVGLAGTTVARDSLKVQAAGALTLDGTLGSQGSSVTLLSGAGLITHGRVVAAGALHAQAGGDAILGGQLSANGSLDLHSGGSLSGKGTLYGGRSLSMTSDGDLHADGVLYTPGAADIAAGGRLLGSGAGILHAGGMLSLDAAGVELGGIADSGSGLHLTSRGNVALSGSLQGGDVSLQATGTLRNTGRIVAGHGLTIRATDIDNGGALSATGASTLDATGALDNRGAIYAAGPLQLEASDLSQAATAQTFAQGGLSVAVSGGLDNAGSLVGGGGLSIRASDIDSTGELGATAGAVSLTSTRGNLVLSGTTAATGALDASAAGDLSLNGDLSATTLQLDSAGTMRLAGNTSSRQDAHLHAGTSFENTGALSSAANLELRSNGDLENLGSITAQQQATLAVGGKLRNGSDASIQAGSDLGIHASSVDSQGTLDAARDFSLGAEGSANLGGLIQASHDAHFDIADALDNAAQVVAGNDLVVAPGSLHNSGALSAGRELALTTPGAVTSDGRFHAGQLFDVQAASLSQSAGAQAASDGNVMLMLAQSLDNAGSLVATGRLDITAQSLASHGELGATAGDVALTATAGDIDLGGTVVAANGLDASAAGMLTQSGKLSATHADLDATGALTTSGTLTGNSLTLHSGTTLTQAGTLSADTISLQAEAIEHPGRSLSRGDLDMQATSIDATGTLAAGMQGDGTLGTNGELSLVAAGSLSAHGSLLAGDALDVEGASLDLSGGTQRAGNDALLWARGGNLDHSDSDLAIGGRLTATAAGELINRASAGHTARLQADHLALSTQALDNGGGQIVQTGAADTSLEVGGRFDNTGGTLSTAATNLSVHAGNLDNSGGNLLLSGDGLLDVHVDGDLANAQGTLAGNGDTTVVAGGAFGNAGGVVDAVRASTVTAGSLDNTAGGIVSGRSLDLDVGGSADNRGGVLQATAGDLQLAADSLDNGGGTVQAAGGALHAQVVHALVNDGGTLGAEGDTQVAAASLSNAQGTVTGAQLALSAAGGVNNDHGSVQSAGNLDLAAGAALSNTGGRIEGGGAMTVQADSLANVGGRIANASTALTRITSVRGLDNRGGTLGGQGDVVLAAGALDNRSQGSLVAGHDLTLDAASLDNRAGTAYAADTLSLDRSTATIANAGGSLGAGRTLSLTAASLDNAGGTVQAGIDGMAGVGNIQLTVGSLTGQGRLFANNALGLHLLGNYTQAAGSSFKANGSFSLAVDGQFTNGGSIQAVDALSISANGITNQAGALLQSADTQLHATHTLSNAGSIQGDTLGIQAATVNNTGTIMGGDVTVRASTLTNGADLGTQTSNPAYQSGTIAATRNVNLYVGQLLNRDAQIYSLGDIHIAGAAPNASGLFDTRASKVQNLSGSIQAHGNILIAANQIDNRRRVLQTTTHTLTQAEWLDAQPLPIADYLYRLNKVQEYATWTEYHTLSQGILTAASAQSRIVAGGNIDLFGSLLNNASTIAAAGHLDVNQRGSGGTTANLVIGSESVANQSLALGRTIQSVAVVDHMGCGWELDLCQPGDDVERITRTPDTNPADYLHDSYVALGAVMSGGQGVSIGGVNVSNGSVTPDGRSVDAVHLDGNAQAIVLHAGDQGPVAGQSGIGLDAQVDPATGHAPQVLGGVGQPLAGVSLPEGGIYHVAAGAHRLSALSVAGMGYEYLSALLGHAPSTNYLIETDPRFTSYSQFVSSDYLLDHLGLDPAKTQMRLGDGFYEQQLVVDQVTQLTGRSYLANYGSGLDEYRALMDGALTEAKALDLSVGVALTADQVAALTQDVVWLVQQEVDGHQVLVPVVYLAGGSLGLTDQGAVIAGSDVSIDATGTLDNGGSILGQNSAVLTAQQLLNGGRIDSQGLTELDVGGDIVNTNGLIHGVDVAVLAGGDIRSSSLAGPPRAGVAGASITADNGLGLLAGHDLTLGGTALQAGQDLSAIAGHDLHLLAAPTISGDLASMNITAGGNLLLGAGHDLTMQAAQPEPGVALGGIIQAGGALAMSAGHDMDLVAPTLSSGGDMALSAGHDLSLGATETVTRTDTTHQVAALTAGGNLSVAAGHDATLQASELSAGQGLALSAGNDLTLGAVTDSKSQSAQWSEGKTHVAQSTYDETVRGVTLQAGTGMAVSAGRDATLTAATLTTDQGNLSVLAGRDLTLNTAEETHSTDTRTVTSKSGFLSHKVTTTHDTSLDTYAIGTTLSGGNVTVGAGRDLSAQAAQIAGTDDVTLAAGGNLTLTTATDKHYESHDKTVKRSGLLGGGGFSIMLGSSTEKTSDQLSQEMQAGSLVGSTDQGVVLSAGHDVHITGSDVLSQTGTAIAGQNVTIDAGLDTTDTRQTYEAHRAGLEVGLSGGAVAAVQSAYGAAKSGSQVKDNRLKALLALQAANSAYSAFQGGSAAAGASSAQGAADSAGVSLRIGLTASKVSSTATTHDETAVGSHIRSNGDISIAATHGDLDVVGSQVAGQNVALSATNDINLTSQAEQHASHQHSNNASAGIGFSIGAQTGWYLTAAAGHGTGHGNGTTHAETTIDASDTLSLVSGNDTTIQGAQLRGNSVLADIGGDLSIASEQDTGDTASQQWQAGGTFVWGSGGSINYNQSKATIQYRSVVEQTGIAAGDGGFQIDVGHHTQLDGAVIGSSADPSRNMLTTGSLGYSSIQNEAEYSSNSSGASLSYSAASSGPGKFGGTIMPPLGGTGDKKGETTSAIAAGTLVVGDGSGLDISRDVAGANDSLNAYDPQSIEEGQAFASNLVGTALAVADDYYATRNFRLTQQMAEAEQNAKDAEASGDVEASQNYWRRAALLREQRDNPAVSMSEVRGVVGLLASAAAGSPSLGYALESSAIGYAGEAWGKAAVGHNETMALKVTCTNQNADQCANGIQIPKDLSPDERLQYAKDHGLDIQYISEIPQGAKVIATNGILNDEARAAQVAIGHAAGDEGNLNGGSAKDMTIYLQFNDTKGALSDLMQAGYDKFAAPLGGDYSATTYAMDDASASQGQVKFEMDGHSWGSITTRNVLYALADNGYKNGNLTVKVFGPAISPGDMVDASQSVIGGDVIKNGSLFYYSDPSDPVASIVGGTLFYSPYLDANRPDKHIPGAAQGNLLGALKGFGAVFGGTINPHSCYALNCQGLPGGDAYNWTVQKAEGYGKKEGAQ